MKTCRPRAPHFRFVANDDLEINLIGDVTDDNSKGPADKTLDINTDGSIVLLNRFNQQVAGPRYGVQFDKALHHQQPVLELRDVRRSDQRTRDAEYQPRVPLGCEQLGRLEYRRVAQHEADPRAS